MPPLRGDKGSLHPGWTAPDHEHSLGLLSRYQWHLLFSARERIDRAEERSVGKVTIVVPNASPNLLWPTLLGLQGELRIGDQRSRHADHVREAVRKDLLGVNGIVDPARDD